jgi:hypothetical protein
MTIREMKSRLVELETRRTMMVKEIERGIDYEDDDMIQTLQTLDDTIAWIHAVLSEIMREEMAG